MELEQVTLLILAVWSLLMTFVVVGLCRASRDSATTIDDRPIVFNNPHYDTNLYRKDANTLLTGEELIVSDIHGAIYWNRNQYVGVPSNIILGEN